MTQHRTHRMYETNIHNAYCICIYIWIGIGNTEKLSLFFFFCRLDLLPFAIFAICTVHTFIHLYMEISRTGARKICLSYKNSFYFPPHRLIVLLLLNINSLTTSTNSIAFAQLHLVIVHETTLTPFFHLKFVHYFVAFQSFCWISAVFFFLLSFSFSLLFSLGFY